MGEVKSKLARWWFETVGIVRRRSLIAKSLSLLASFLVTLLALDFLFPLKLPQQADLYARITVDEHGRPLRAFADTSGVWRYPVTLDEVSPLYVEALLTYEDRWFWWHPGVNPFSLLRAAGQNLWHGKRVSGGSTISMQVARLLHPHSRTLVGKMQQVLRTLQLEWQLDKREILNLYLNVAPFGGTIEGVQAASFTYLNKSAAELSHAEAALLAVLPQAPTRYRPDINADKATVARNKVLDRMATKQRWSKGVVAEAKLERVNSFRNRQQQIAPLLSRRLLKAGGGQLAIQTTIDGDLQRALEDYLKEYKHRWPQKTSAAVMVVENKSAEVKAYLGSADFSDIKRFGHVDMIQAIRSPGSTLKPFLFGMAIDDGLIHSHSLLADVPRTWGDYRPSNFNNRFSGAVSASEALQRSLNVPFIDLLERLGPKRFAAMMRSAGLPLLIPGGEPNLSIVLGGAGVSLEQLVVGYVGMARGGKTIPLRYLKQGQPFAQIESPLGERYMVSQGAAWTTLKILSEVSRPGSIQTLANKQTTGGLAWKTGTSFGYRDAWAIGVTKDYTIGVWVGRPDGTPLQGQTGRETAGPLLFAVADHMQLDMKATEPPASVEQQEICWPLGTRSVDRAQCGERYAAWIVNDTVPPTWHAADSGAWQENPYSFWVNEESGLRVDSQCVALNPELQTAKTTVALWPKVLDPWLPLQFRRNQLVPSVDPACGIAALDSGSKLEITGITPNSIYRSAGSSTQSPSVTFGAIGGTGQYHWYINGEHKFTGSSTDAIPYTISQLGAVQILVVDDAGNLDKVEIEVR